VQFFLIFGFERKRNEWSYYPILNVYVFLFSGRTSGGIDMIYSTELLSTIRDVSAMYLINTSYTLNLTVSPHQ
jgi:hypothetical protein